MAKKKTKKSTAKTVKRDVWGGFTPFQLIIICAVFIVFAVYMLM